MKYYPIVNVLSQEPPMSFKSLKEKVNKLNLAFKLIIYKIYYTIYYPITQILSPEPSSINFLQVPREMKIFSIKLF